MGMTIRVSTPGNNALTDTNIDHYSVYADSDNVLIKEQSRGTVGVADGSTGTITHDLNYIPFYLAYCQISSSRYRLNTFNSVTSSSWRLTINQSSLQIRNAFGTAGTLVRYYIFYDNIGGF